MKKRPGFTLAELVISVLIFGFMSTSLATIYSTANRHMFQNYRNNTVKSNVSLAMRDIRRNLQQATRIDVPAYGNGGTELKFVSNVDQITGCYPVNPAAPVTWHYFCVANDPSDAGVQDLYHYTGTVGTDATWCGSSPDRFWDPNTQYPVPGCGANGGIILMKYSVQAPFGGPNSLSMFSRVPAAPDNVYERDAVLVTLRSHWVAATRFNAARPNQRDVDFLLSSKVKLLTPSN